MSSLAYTGDMTVKTEIDWRAEDDMRTLMRASAIRSDPKRVAAAKKAAKRKLEEQNAETRQMKALAGE